MLKLQRLGKKQHASYRLVVGEKRSKLNGEQIEYLGWYEPRHKKYSFNKERVLYWFQKGAKTTDTVNNLLVKHGIISGKKISVHKKSKGQGEQPKPETQPVKEAATA